ncbi:hypothetical protein GIB67_038334 [Kingdonia uniflora]|uniref:Uncharacterized protein n=1 Tax=Kingdonia uniflora TaxID=39325 RepID=A0A7J7KUK7_9MAGN|nr:hypothetical protein GIB67_038334 [Kingdonia uniflora]
MAASATLSVANPSSLQGKGMSEFSGLRNTSTSLSFSRKTSDDLLSVIAFQTAAVSTLAPSFLYITYYYFITHSIILYNIISCSWKCMSLLNKLYATNKPALCDNLIN